MARGRHRAPVQHTGAKAAVATATGLAILAQPGSALAAGSNTDEALDLISKCETGGRNIMNYINDSMHTAGGFWQITNTTWKLYGGTEFAPTAIQATADQQRTVAARILAARPSGVDWDESRHCWGGQFQAALSGVNVTDVHPGGGGSAAPAKPPAPAPAPQAPAQTQTWTHPLPNGVTVPGGEFGAGRDHQGRDFAAPDGTPIVAAGPGTVQAGNEDGYGNVIRITHPDGTVTLYAHNQKNLVTGGTVEAGQKIALVGRTGQVTGAHVHFEVHPNGGPAVDPAPWLKSHVGQPVGGVPATPAPDVPKVDPGAEMSYTVREKDALSRIAAANGVMTQELADWNGITDINLIFPGQVLRLTPPGAAPATPAPGGEKYHTQEKDTLKDIAASHGLGDWRPTYEANRAVLGPNPDIIPQDVDIVLVNADGAHNLFGATPSVP